MVGEKQFKKLIEEIIINSSNNFFHDLNILWKRDSEKNIDVCFTGYDRRRAIIPVQDDHFFCIENEDLKNTVYCLERIRDKIIELLEEPTTEEKLNSDFKWFVFINRWCTVRPFEPVDEYFRYKVDLKNAVEHVCRKIDELIIQSKEQEREKKEKAKIRRQMKKNKEATEKKEETDK